MVLRSLLENLVLPDGEMEGDPLIAGFGQCDKGDTDVGVRRFRLAYTN